MTTRDGLRVQQRRSIQFFDPLDYGAWAPGDHSWFEIDREPVQRTSGDINMFCHQIRNWSKDYSRDFRQCVRTTVPE
jgi:hypothetical protein